MEPNTLASPDAPPHPLGSLKPARQWVKDEGPPIFNSWDSFAWFERTHRAEFAACEAWVKTSRGTFVTPEFSAFVRSILDREARTNRALKVAA